MESTTKRRVWKRVDVWYVELNGTKGMEEYAEGDVVCVEEAEDLCPTV
jgi:hypothetical protein